MAKRIRGRSRGQTRIERRARIEPEPLPLKAVGRAAGDGVAFADRHPQPVSGQQCPTAQSADAAANHYHIGIRSRCHRRIYASHRLGNPHKTSPNDIIGGFPSPQSLSLVHEEGPKSLSTQIRQAQPRQPFPIRLDILSTRQKNEGIQVDPLVSSLRLKRDDKPILRK